MPNGPAAATDKSLSHVMRIDEAQIQQHLGEIVRSTVEQTFNGMPDAEADQLCNARRWGIQVRHSRFILAPCPRKTTRRRGTGRRSVPSLSSGGTGRINSPGSISP
jgi:hypothetical protein